MLKSLFGLPLAMLLLLLVSGCTGGNPLSLLTGSGPNVAANVQAGETNTQTLGTTEVREVKQVVKQAEVVEQSADENNVRTETVEQLIIETPIGVWWIVAFVLWSLFLFWLPSPNQIGQTLLNIFRRNK